MYKIMAVQLNFTPEGYKGSVLYYDPETKLHADISLGNEHCEKVIEQIRYDLPEVRLDPYSRNTCLLTHDEVYKEKGNEPA